VKDTHLDVDLVVSEARGGQIEEREVVLPCQPVDILSYLFETAVERVLGVREGLERAGSSWRKRSLFMGRGRACPAATDDW